MNPTFATRFRKQLWFQLFVIAGIAFLLVFSYLPMFGILMAFKKYDITMGIGGIFTSPWNGLGYFREFAGDYRFGDLVRNTLAISLLKLVFTFPLPILLAVMLNEVRNRVFKRFVQTASYFPHFISWIIVSGMALTFLSANGGLVNKLLVSLHLIDKPLQFMVDPDYFWGLAVFTAVWKDTGWWTIIFLAAIAGIDTSLYESAQIDGAGRLRRIWHITLPGMQGTIVVVLILALGNLLGGGLSGSSFEQSFLLGNPANSDKSEIIQTYAFKMGLVNARYAYAAAVDLVQSVISVALVFGSNFVAKRLSSNSLF